MCLIGLQNMIKEIFRVTYPLIRATCPQERSQRPLKRAKGPQKPFARVQIMVLKGPCILVKKNKDTFFNPTLNKKIYEISLFCI